MSQVAVNGVVVRADFSQEIPDPIPFSMDGDVFWALGDAPGGAIAGLAAVQSAPNEAARVSAVVEFFNQVLLRESAELFTRRFQGGLAADKTAEQEESEEGAEEGAERPRPITLKQSLNVFKWLVGEYTGNIRPTQAPSPSQPGSGSIAPSSTAVAPSPGMTTGEEVLTGL